MIIQAFLALLINFVNVLFSWLPPVTSLPAIGGYDIDSALVTGVAQAYAFGSYIWPIGDVMLGAAVLWGYYGVKMLLKLVLGSRAPGHH